MGTYVFNKPSLALKLSKGFIYVSFGFWQLDSQDIGKKNWLVHTKMTKQTFPKICKYFTNTLQKLYKNLFYRM